jgi:alpha-1,2-mannosyltransferase
MKKSISSILVAYVTLIVHCVVFPLVFPLLACILRLLRRFRASKKTIAFFHPFALSGGGGERVLWQAVHGLLTKDPTLHIVIYSSQIPKSFEVLASTVQKSFGISLSEDKGMKSPQKRIRFVYSPFSDCVDPSHFPVATMFCQLVGSMVMAVHCLTRFPYATMLVDSIGWAPTLLVAKLLLGCSTSAYVHYPTISEDVHLQTTSSKLRFAYLSAMWHFYAFCGSFVDFAMANSTWTLQRIRRIWPSTSVVLVYPPCPVEDLHEMFQKTRHQTRERVVVSIGQYRPEKNHPLQFEAFAALLARPGMQDVKLVIVGSTRNDEDRQRVETLKQLASSQYDLQEGRNVEFRVNVPYSEMVDCLRRATVGLHAMRDEHFGISIVEYMAAGVVPVAHRSGGPLEDIVGTDETCGFLAQTAEDYATQMEAAFHLAESQLEVFRRAAAARCRMFSTAAFEDKIVRLLLSKLG